MLPAPDFHDTPPAGREPQSFAALARGLRQLVGGNARGVSDAAREWTLRHLRSRTAAEHDAFAVTQTVMLQLHVLPVLRRAAAELKGRDRTWAAHTLRRLGCLRERLEGLDSREDADAADRRLRLLAERQAIFVCANNRLFMLYGRESLRGTEPRAA